MISYLKRSAVGYFGLFLFLAFSFVGCNPKKGKETDKGMVKEQVEELVSLEYSRIGRSTVIANLDVPWELVWGPDNWIWFTEQGGRVSRVNPETGEVKLLLEIPNVFRKRTTGLLGMAVHPDLERFPYVFVHYTEKREDAIVSKLVRYTYEKEVLVAPQVLLEIPGHTSHNGSRLLISPDGKIMWATGDVGPNTDNSQNIRSMNGKILRLNMDGSIPEDNPFFQSPVWSWGQRNVQGMAYGTNGHLYTSEHGDATDDEVNLMKKGGNYGWPNVEGFCDTPREESFCRDSLMVPPLKSWTPTIAPAGIDYYGSTNIPEWENSLLLATLKENDLRVLKLNKEGNAIVSEKVLFDRSMGRIRDLCISPKGDVYLSTSNRDWNPSEGFPVKEDDRIIKIFKVGPEDGLSENTVVKQPVDVGTKGMHNPPSKGEVKYAHYCASCHKPDGDGVKGVFPALNGSGKVMGNKEQLIKLALYGVNSTLNREGGSPYDSSMPGFHFLSNEDMALILSYVRQQFGGSLDSISPQEINAVRTQFVIDD
ncbi:MAG: PQQ-dependent sugar dehydrogenase [Flavobacteriaceae bacterium]